MSDYEREMSGKPKVLTVWFEKCYHPDVEIFAADFQQINNKRQKDKLWRVKMSKTTLTHADIEVVTQIVAAAIAQAMGGNAPAPVPAPTPAPAPETVPVPAPVREKKSASSSRRRCTATRLDGQPCKGWALGDSDTCFAHRAQRTGAQGAESPQERKPSHNVYVMRTGSHDPAQVATYADKLGVGDSLDMGGFRWRSSIAPALRASGKLRFVGDSTWVYELGEKTYQVRNVTLTKAKKHGTERDRSITRTS